MSSDNKDRLVGGTILKKDNRDEHLKSNEKDKISILSDDEAVLEISKLDEDKILDKDYLSSLISQEDRLLSFEILNIYKSNNNEKFKSKLELKNNPPILLIKDNIGNEVTITLSSQLTSELLRTLNQVERAHAGLRYPKESDPERTIFDKILLYFKENSIKSILTIAIIVIVIMILI